MKYKIIITAGGTSERIDNVRKITNSSSGKLGTLIASKLIELNDSNIDKIYYICSKNAVKTTNSKIEIIEIVDTNDLKVVVEKLLTSEKIDYFVHAMAVSDYTVDFVTTATKITENIKNHPNGDIYDLICHNRNNIRTNKISSDKDDLIIKLKRTPKIISIIKKLSPNTHLIGFKLLDGVSKEELVQVATNLLNKNNCDLVVANDLSNIRNGNHLAFIINKNNEYVTASGKEDIALKLIREMFKNA